MATLIMYVTIENFISTFYLWTTLRVTNLNQIRFGFKRLFDDFYFLFCANYWYIDKTNLFSLSISLHTSKCSKRIWPFAWFKWFFLLFSFKNHLFYSIFLIHSLWTIYWQSLLLFINIWLSYIFLTTIGICNLLVSCANFKFFKKIFTFA